MNYLQQAEDFLKFESFEEGWDFVYENIQEEFEDDGTYEDIYVVPKK